MMVHMALMASANGAAAPVVPVAVAAAVANQQHLSVPLSAVALELEPLAVAVEALNQGSGK